MPTVMGPREIQSLGQAMANMPAAEAIASMVNGDTAVTFDAANTFNANNTFDGQQSFQRLDMRQGTALVDGDFALGAGCGSTATIAVATGSTDGAGKATITFGGAGLDQATATATLTFKDGAFAAAPFAVACRAGGTTGPTVGLSVTTTTTTMVVTVDTLPVDTETFIFSWVALG